MPDKTKRPPTGPNLKIAPNLPQPAPTPAGEVAINSQGETIGGIVETILRERGVTPPQSTAELALLVKLAQKVPPWVVYVGLLFGGPLLTFLAASYQTASKIPGRIEALETASKTQGDLLKSQGETLKEILNRLPVSPSTRPIGENK